MTRGCWSRRGAGKRGVLATMLAGALTSGCGARNYSVERVEGSLEPFFADPLVCSCSLSQMAGEITFACSARTQERREQLGWEPSFTMPLSGRANFRYRTRVSLFVDDPSWALPGVGKAAAEVEYGDQPFTLTGNPEDSKYLEVFVWLLDVPAQRVCSGDSSCRNIDPGRLVTARFGCGVDP